MEEVIKIMKFSEVDKTNEFFDSLRNDYSGFDAWFDRKAKSSAEAYVQINKDSQITAFLYLKDESNEICELFPDKPKCKRLKVGTFKICSHNTRLGERFVKKIMDVAIQSKYEEVYLTIFPNHESLKGILRKYGFVKKTEVRGEEVMLKELNNPTDDILTSYPQMRVRNKPKYLLAIYPKYHTKMFPDSILNNEVNESYDLVKDVSSTNSIHKIYLCFMPETKKLKYGDIIVIYRTSDGLGPAYYRSVVTSVCQVEEVKKKDDFGDVEEFIKYTNVYSLFDVTELRNWYYKRRELVVIKMLYNIALTKRVVRQTLLNEIGMPADEYWGFMKLKDEWFHEIIKRGNINENYIID
jgi:hypothetical protein